MMLKMVPKKWGGCQVVSFHTLIPRKDEQPYMGAALLQSVPDLFTVVLLGSDSVDNDVWRAVGKPVPDLSWSAAQSLLQTHIQRNPN
jgi:hypothetical protein